MGRHQDWESRLARYLESREKRPFKWGTNDCALFACGAIKAMTGVDPGKPFRRKYSTALGAAGIIRQEKCATLRGLVSRIARKCQMPPVPPFSAGRGDAVLVRLPNRRTALAIVGLDGMMAVAPGLKGQLEIPMSAWVKAWRVGA